MQHRRFAASAIALAALVGSLAACGDDSDDTGSKTDDTEAAAPVDLTVKATSEGGQFAFDLPAEISGGLVNLTLDNEDNQPHEIAMVKVKDGTKADDVVGWLDSDGGPVPDAIEYKVAGVGNAAPGQKATSTQEIEPGTYVYFCTFGDGDEVHYKNGMLGEVEVTDAKGEGDLPATDNTIVAEDWTFSNLHLKAGDGAVKVDFKNIGPNELHHAQLVPLKEGATAEQALAELAAGGDGPPASVDFENATGTMVLGPGQEQVTDLTLKKGDYLVLCFLSDKAGGPPHFLPQEAGGHGMVGTVTVD
jgi:plastocyanin